MEILENIASASTVLFTLGNILIIPFGLFLGIIVGAIPGMTAPMGTALVLPFTFFMAPVPALLLLLGVYKGGIYAGSIPAILFNTPGTVAASCTTLDGFPLAQQGQARKALDLALYASVAADVIANFMLILFTGFLARLALEFGAPETFSLIFFSLFIISSISGDQLMKGIIAVLFGLFLATVGVDSYFGSYRFAFDNINMVSGFSILPLLVGLFALSEILYRLSSKESETKLSNQPLTEGVHLSFAEFKGQMRTIVRGSLIGTFLGAIPGIGAAPAAFFSYSEARRKSKRSDLFGKGSLEGIAAAESANNAVCSASFIPVLALGIPGGTAAAVIMGAFMVQGLTPGPILFKENLDVVYSLYMGLMIGSVFLLGIGLVGVRLFSKLAKLRDGVLFPTVLVMCLYGGYVTKNNMFDLQVMLMAGLVGLVFKWFRIPAAPFLIGFILGPLLEGSFRETLQQNEGNILAFFSSGITWFFWILSAASLYFIVRRRRLVKPINKSEEPVASL